MAKTSARPLRTIKPSAGTPSVSRRMLAEAARSVSIRRGEVGQFTDDAGARARTDAASSQREKGKTSHISDGRKTAAKGNKRSR